MRQFCGKGYEESEGMMWQNTHQPQTEGMITGINPTSDILSCEL